MYLTKDNRMFYALLIAIAIQSVGVYTLISLKVFEFSAGSLPIVAVIVGSFILELALFLLVVVQQGLGIGQEKV